MENMEENCEMIWKIWKKASRLNSEKIWKIQKKFQKDMENSGKLPFLTIFSNS